MGVRRVLLPRANTKDVRALPEAVRTDLEFVFVENFVEVMREALPALASTPCAAYAP